MRRITVIALVLFIVCRCASAENIEESNVVAVERAIIKTQSDIKRDTAALNEIRAGITEQRRPLAARLEELQKTVKTSRADVERIRRLRNQGEKEQVALEVEVVAVEEECRFLRALFAEYARAMETRVGAAEAPGLVERLGPIQKALTAEDSSNDFADAVGELLALSATSSTDRLGGSLFEGFALDAHGVERQGRFAVFGPVAWFAAESDGPAGLVQTKFGSVLPGIYDRLPDNAVAGVKKLVQGGLARVPVDVTGGDAIKVAEAGVTFLEHVRKGGFVMIPLLVVALVAILLAVWKTIELGVIRVETVGEVDSVIQAVRRGNIDEARRTSVGIRQPLRSLVEEVVEHSESPRDHLEEIMHEHVLAALPGLERNLGTLAVLGGIAPLLGLLGTVTGMIHTFQLVTIFGSGDAKLLSGGISEALVTTETGLVIAIPVLLAHAFLARRARGIIGALERAAVGMVNDIKARSVES